MELRQLTYYLEVANHLSFSKAADKLHLSQPTLSKMIKSLEDELGIVLLDRSTRSVRLTEAGEVVLDHALAIKQSMDNLLAAASDLAQMKKGKITLGLPPVIGASFFPEIIARFHRLYPNIKIHLMEEGGKLIEQLLLGGNIDLGIVVLPVDEQLFEAAPIVERKLQLVVGANHPLARKNAVRLKDLRDEPFILFREGFALHDRVRDACVREGFEPNVVYESGQWDFIGEMVASGLGIAMLPETVCGKLDRSKVAVIEEIEPKIHWDLAVIWRKNSYLSYAARGWIEFVRKFFVDANIEK